MANKGKAIIAKDKKPAPVKEPKVKVVKEPKVKEPKVKKPKDKNLTFWQKVKNIAFAIGRFFKKAYKTVLKYLDTSNRKNWLTVLGQVLIYALLVVIGYVFISPFLEIISKAFMDTRDIIDQSVFYVPRNAPTLGNFNVAIKQMHYWEALFGSIWYSGLMGILQTIVSALAAFAFARYDFKFKKFWLVCLIASFIVPSIVLVSPRRMMFTQFKAVTGINILNSPITVILMTLLGQGVYSAILILIFYNFFKQIPYELDEAAYMDGASSVQVFYHVIIRLSLPIILTVFLFSFIWNWNETVMTNAFIPVESVRLMPRSLEAMSALDQIPGAEVSQNEGYKMAATLISILPLVILYMFVQKRFIEGIEQTGITGV